MTREELEHAIRAACDMAGETELWIFGSQAILGEHPGAPEALRQSVEVDVALKNRPDHTELIDRALGELSLFHRTHGFYVHCLSLDSATLPEGWDGRTVLMQNEGTRYNRGYCLETHDVAASKLVAFREKDRDFVRTLLVEGLVKAKTLLERIRDLPVDDEVRYRLMRWVEGTSREL